MTRVLPCSIMTGLIVIVVSLTGCDVRREAIELSNTDVRIDRSEAPFRVQAWNSSTAIDNLAITVTTNAAWLIAEPATINSDKPQNGILDKRSVNIRVDRRRLKKGTHNGEVTFRARQAFPKTIKVRVIQDVDGVMDALTVVSPEHRYIPPYLIEFSFSLRDEDNRSVIAQPAQFQLSAREDNTLVNPNITGVHLRSGRARQLRVDLVLDYSLNMQLIPGAIAAMENAAMDILLPALNADAQVGVVEFHRNDQNPQRVSGFTVDRNYTRSRINSIAAEYPSGSRAWDAMMRSLGDFSTGNAPEEARYIILFSDGNDTSSWASIDDVVNEAKARDVRLYAIGMGDNVNASDLYFMTSATVGEYFPAAAVDQLDDAFQNIVDDLGGQYILRWFSLKRRDADAFFPSYTIGIAGDTAEYTAPARFVPSQHAGNELKGQLRLVQSSNDVMTTAFLRADYVPRYISKMRLFLHSPLPFTVSLVGAADDGLMGGWSLTVTPDPATGGRWIEVTSPGSPMPFASFGPMIRFNFGQLADPDTVLFDQIEVDNSIYTQIQNPPYFEVEGYENSLPKTDF
jgi:hypothetical protein